MIPQDNAESLIVNGIPVERKLLESRAVRRCELQECQAHCCSCGVYLNVDDAKRILAHKDMIIPHLGPDRRDPETWFDWTLEPDNDHPEGGMLAGTNVAKDPTHPAGQNCVFLRPDRKCGLQAASIAAGEHPWHFKPFYCALFPLVFHQHQLMLDDDNLVYTEGGSCTRPACGEPIPLYRLFEVEMKLAIGETGYAELLAKVGDAPEAAPPKPPALPA
jgi:Fe-S-cluster containining protein